MIEKHIWTDEFKKDHLGDGEWVKEPDEVDFVYKEYKCKIIRIFLREPFAKQEIYFGGHLCGYVFIPKEHVLFGQKYDDINVDCHYGLTFGEFDSNNEFLIGFDCAHSCDYVPSTEKLRMENKSIYDFPEEFKTFSIFNPQYRNIQFCIDQCKSIVDQLIDIGEEKNDR